KKINGLIGSIFNNLYFILGPYILAVLFSFCSMPIQEQMNQLFRKGIISNFSEIHIFHYSMFRHCHRFR
ncbi:hypothetical protein L9F63_000205, partial [Diploptera punctata]